MRDVNSDEWILHVGLVILQGKVDYFLNVAFLLHSGLLPGLQMGQGLWRVVRNQQLQQEGYSEQGYLSREQSRRMAASSISNTSHRKQVQGGIDIYHLLKTRKSKEQEGFINLEMLPPELSFTILSYLNATDLCLASCVWQDLANDELLWQG